MVDGSTGDFVSTTLDLVFVLKRTAGATFQDEKTRVSMALVCAMDTAVDRSQVGHEKQYCTVMLTLRGAWGVTIGGRRIRME